MTYYRRPPNWHKKEPDKRPPLPKWLAPERALTIHNESYSIQNSYNYWTKIYWATPPWVEGELLEQIKAIYESADSATEHVDHIVPIKSPIVCGLNVPWNLQRVPIEENYKKSNHYWPGHPVEIPDLFEGLG